MKLRRSDGRTARLRFKVIASLFASFCVALLPHPARAQVPTIPIALGGEAAPGAPGRTFLTFGFVAIHDSGHVIFSALLDQSDTTNDNGIWVGTPGDIELAVREGDVAPGTGGLQFEGFTPRSTNTGFTLHHPQMNGAGEFAFVGVLKGEEPFHFGGGVWSGTPGNLSLVARAGDPAPGTVGRTFQTFRPPFIDEAGNVLFGARLDDLSETLWYSGSDGLVPVVTRGQAAPGEPGRTFDRTNEHESYTMSPAGQVIFTAIMEDASAARPNTVWVGDPENPRLLVESGDPAPGTNSTFTSTLGIQVQDISTALLFGRLGGVGNSSYWTGTPGNLTLVGGARRGDPAPGTGLPFQFMSVPMMNDAGTVVFDADLEPIQFDGPTDIGIWAGQPGNFELIARQYETAPGTGGAVFRNAGGNGRPFGAPSINAAGEVVFESRLLTSDSRVGYGVWIWQDGTLTSVVNSTQPFEVSRCDVRTVTFVHFNASRGALGSGLGGIYGQNAQDQIVFQAQFLDPQALDRGLFVTGDPPPDDGEPCPIPGVDPSITITSPANEAVITTEEILVVGVATDDSLVVSVVVNDLAAELVSTGNPSDSAEVFFSATIPRDPSSIITVIAAAVTDDEDNTTFAFVFVENGQIEAPLVCDANGDGSVDRVDIAEIFAARGSVATGPDDPRDVNRDGLISVNDGRLCVLECNLPRCGISAP